MRGAPGARTRRSLAALWPPPSMTSDARPVTGWSSIRQSRGPLLAAATLLICLLLALHRGWTEPAGGAADYECTNAEDELRGLSRHGRRRRRREVLTQVDLLPDQMARLQKARSREAGRAVEAMQSTLRLARCIVRCGVSMNVRFTQHEPRRMRKISSLGEPCARQCSPLASLRHSPLDSLKDSTHVCRCLHTPGYRVARAHHAAGREPCTC